MEKGHRWSGIKKLEQFFYANSTQNEFLNNKVIIKSIGGIPNDSFAVVVIDVFPGNSGFGALFFLYESL